MSSQHLSDEATAAFADGVLSGGARDRATRHVALCHECAEAVAVQREAILRLRAAAAPTLPGSLLARLQNVPQTAVLDGPPTVLGSDGSPMFVAGAPTRFGTLGARFGEAAGPFSAAAVVPVAESSTRKRGASASGMTLALVALAAGVLTASATSDAPAGAGPAHTSHGGVVAPAQNVVGTVRFERPATGR